MTTPPTVLDTAFLKAFILEIQGFKEGPLQAIEGVITLVDVGEKIETSGALVATKPLIIGNMGAAGAPGAAAGVGASLNTTVNASVVEIARILEEQTLLFEEIKTALEETVNALKKTQDSIIAITPEEFLDIFEDVDSAFSGSGNEDEG